MTANNARTQLRSKLKGTTTRRTPLHTSKLVDDRQVKRPRSAYISFTGERRASGDFKNIGITESAKLIAEEWKALSAGEKKVCSFQSSGPISAHITTEISRRADSGSCEVQARNGRTRLRTVMFSSFGSFASGFVRWLVDDRTVNGAHLTCRL